MPAQTALEAMSAVLPNEETGAAPEIEEVETPEGEEAPDGEEVETLEGEEAPEGEEVETLEGEEAPEGEEGEGDDSEDEEGDEGEELETPEAKTAREAAEKATAAEKAAVAKPIDLLGDPIPKDLSVRTQKRMTGLIDRVKDLEPRAAQGDELVGYITDSQMTADEFGMALTFGKLKHSDNVEDHRKAYAILWQGLRELAPLVGETLPGVDPLEGHADLQARVAAKTLDPKDAAEMAVGRNRQKADAAARQRNQANAQTVAQRAQQNQDLEQQVYKELNELGDSLRENDPKFDAKVAAISAAVRAQIKSAPPALRVQTFLKAFLAVKLPAPVSKPVVKQKQQPMRAGKVPAAAGGSVRREAKSAVEALDFALGLK